MYTHIHIGTLAHPATAHHNLRDLRIRDQARILSQKKKVHYAGTNSKNKILYADPRSDSVTKHKSCRKKKSPVYRDEIYI